jgi:hypothetical protein
MRLFITSNSEEKSLHIRGNQQQGETPMTKSKHTGRTLGGRAFEISIPTPKLDFVPEAVQPFIEIGMKLQSEFLEMWGHRYRAWLGWQEEFCACKTMDDLTTAQGDYLTRMHRDYTAFLDGVLHDAMVVQDELDEDDNEPVVKPEDATNPLHHKAA